MGTRFNINSGPGGLPSGYNSNVVTEDYQIPSCGVEDVDMALFNMFDKELKFEYENSSDKSKKKIPVIFASGEKWALLKNNKPIRDKNDTLILPLITIVRTGITQDSTTDIEGRGINQQTGVLTIKRRLSHLDRAYQNLINRLGVVNQQNLAVNPDVSNGDQVLTDRTTSDLLSDPDIKDGGLLKYDLKNNVYEVLTIPSPQFYTAKYEITFWTQYTVQMNQMLEKLMSAYLPQGTNLKLDTPKGYWFIGRVDATTFSPETNFNDMTSDERLIKCKFTINVPAYLVASDAPGVPKATRQYVTDPSIKFGSDVDTIPDPYLGADDPTLPLDLGDSLRDDMRLVNLTTPRLTDVQDVSQTDPSLESHKRGQKLDSYKKVKYTNPITGKEQYRNVRVLKVNKFTGETVISSAGDLDFFDSYLQTFNGEK